MSKWRYQPVYSDDPSGRSYFLIEVHFPDSSDELGGWTDMEGAPAPHGPMGNSIEDLTGEIARMLVDAFRWVPVEYDKLKTGMIFQRLISPAEGEALAQSIERWTHNFKPAPETGGERP